MALLGCSGTGPRLDREGEALAVEYGGCDVITGNEAPTCVLVTDRLHLWVEDPEAERVEVWLDEQRVEPERYRRDELLGAGLTLAVSAQASSVRVILDRGRDRSAEWSLRLSHEDPEQSVRSARARIAQDASEGRIPQALQRLEQLRLAAPWTTDTTYAALSVAHHLAQTVGDPERAEALLLEYEELASRSPQGRAELANTRGTVYWRLGRLDEAAIAYREAARHALRIRNNQLELSALMMYSELLVELGYLRAAGYWAQHVRRLLDQPDAIPRDVASASSTIGWIGLQLRAAGRDELDPEEPYREALALLRPDGAAANPRKLGLVWLGLARVALDDGDPGEALARLDRIDQTLVGSNVRMHALDLRARASLQQGASAAVIGPVLDELEASAEEIDTPHARWQHAVLRGRLAERDGNVNEAIEHYRHAEQLHDEASQLAVLGMERGTSGALGPEATQRLLGILVDDGRADQALCTARLSRARALRALVLPENQQRELDALVRDSRKLAIQIEQQEISSRDLPGREQQQAQRKLQELRQRQEQLSTALILALGRHADAPTCEELTTRGPGELMLALHPVDGGWLVLAADDLGVTADRVPVSGPLSSRTPKEQADLLLAPVREQIARAERIRVTAVGDAIDIDVHALPFQGAPLVAHAPVSYGVELREHSLAPLSAPLTALLIGDVTGSLWSASPEVQAVEQDLLHAGWAILLPADPGSLSQVLGELTRADLFHYAGHAGAATGSDAVQLWPPYGGGAPGWSSYLQLEPPTRLDVHEILMLSRVPRWVVLNGCHTGVLDVQNAGISLALAFLAAGSEQVLASPEKVDDLLVGEIGRRLYDGLMPNEPLDLTARVQEVLRARVEAGEPVGRVRVWVR